MGWWRSLFPSSTHGADVQRRLRRERAKPIVESSGGGVVSIGGTVDPLDALASAPLTGRRCVYWTLTISEIMMSLMSIELANLDGGSPFLVVDAANRARVIPERARIAAPAETRLRAVRPVAVTGVWGPFAYEPPLLSPEEWKIVGPLRLAIARTSRLRLTEYVIEPDATVLVRGFAEVEPDPHGGEVGYRESPTRLVLSSSPRRPLLIRATPGRPSVQAGPGP